MAGKRSAPVWALAAILFLGWNEFMAVLFNPVYLIFGALMFLFSWQMYGELDVDAEMQRGPLVGLFNMWNKLGDVLRNVSGGGGAAGLRRDVRSLQPCMLAGQQMCCWSCRRSKCGEGLKRAGDKLPVWGDVCQGGWLELGLVRACLLCACIESVADGCVCQYCACTLT
eukprot:GHRQ01029052.1.p1 GENE.GHRQ01029052.1~~GHRQ01029052.1.p1  ORF type:complete len:169 (-),score=34.97 GHRQ01029052.1:145-651(-)